MKMVKKIQMKIVIFYGNENSLYAVGACFRNALAGSNVSVPCLSLLILFQMCCSSWRVVDRR